MDYTDLKRRLAERAKNEHAIQANNEAVATALRGQRLLFEQGARSEAISYAMRLCLEHENCAKHDAALAADWDESFAAIAALEAEVARLRSAKRVSFEFDGRDWTLRADLSDMPIALKAGDIWNLALADQPAEGEK